MANKRKRVRLILAGILLIIMVISFSANTFFENKVEALLKANVPEHIETNYEAITVNIFLGRVALKNPSFNIKLKDTNLVQSQLSMSTLSIGGISYWDYLVNKEISVGKINFNDLQVSTYKDRKNPAKDSTQKKPMALPGPIHIGKISIQDGQLSVYDSSKDSSFVHVEKLQLDLRKVLVNDRTLQNEVPMTYQSIRIETDSIFLKAGDFENLYASALTIEENDLSLEGVLFKTKYSKAHLSKIIKTERDHIHVTIDAVNINAIDFGKKKDTTYFSTPLLVIKQPNAQIYRDKSVADDLTFKKLYSRSIRELPIKLTIDSIAIQNGSVTYGEKVKADNPPGVLSLSHLNVGVSNLSNTYTSPAQTTIEVQGTFMKNSPLRATWNFDVNKTNDAFSFQGYLGTLMTSDLNVFISPLLNVELDGEVVETHFEITGNENQSTINIAQNYEDINVNIFNKKHKKMKVLSGIANVFIKNNSKSEGKRIHNVNATTTRDKTKSFFNYLARNLKASLVIMYTKKEKTKKKKAKKKKLE